jgi:hypothetical protein
MVQGLFLGGGGPSFGAVADFKVIISLTLLMFIKYSAFDFAVYPAITLMQGCKTYVFTANLISQKFH